MQILQVFFSYNYFNWIIVNDYNYILSKNVNKSSILSFSFNDKLVYGFMSFGMVDQYVIIITRIYVNFYEFLVSVLSIIQLIKIILQLILGYVNKYNFKILFLEKLKLTKEYNDYINKNNFNIEKVFTLSNFITNEFIPEFFWKIKMI